MPHSRFYLATLFSSQQEVVLSGDEAHHLQKAMRKKIGESVELVNGMDQLACARVLSFEKKGVCLRIDSVEEKKPFGSMILCQAIPRLNRLDTIVEKGTELGMKELWLFPAELSEKKELSPTQLKRLETISISALKQCGRLDLPKIVIKPPLLKWEPLAHPAYYGDPSDNAPLFSTQLQRKTPIFFLIGPESGFSDNEKNHLHHINVIGVKLHPHILRTETASLTAISIFACS